ncbi:ferredoxin [Streptomyces sp. NPDC056723]|uniref:ferredoxin n=1 Tax=Streptomyces sp. NPDC056723 TaxID=3345925 RepID=UPI00367AD51C
MKIHMHEAKCVGGGQCVLAAPDVFDQRDDDGIAFLLIENPGAELDEQVREAARLCPALAIEVDER